MKRVVFWVLIMVTIFSACSSSRDTEIEGLRNEINLLNEKLEQYQAEETFENTQYDIPILQNNFDKDDIMLSVRLSFAAFTIFDFGVSSGEVQAKNKGRAILGMKYGNFTWTTGMITMYS